MVNDVLCYLSTRKNYLAQSVVVTNTVGFYEEIYIKKAKAIFFKICNEKAVRRVVCNSHPNPLLADVFFLFDKVISVTFKTYSCPRDWRLSASGGANCGPP